MYALRKTHISWARCLVNPDSVKVQVGHAPRDTQERHYLDLKLVDVRQAAQAVWNVLTGQRSLPGEHHREPPLRLAVGAENVRRDPAALKRPDVSPSVDPKGDQEQEGGEEESSEGIDSDGLADSPVRICGGGPTGIRTPDQRIMSPLL